MCSSDLGFRMNDDREVSCLALLARQQSGQPMEAPGEWREQARQAWWAQKDADFGCDAMAQAFFAAGVLEPADVWRKLRLAIEADKPKAVQQAARLLGDPVSQAVDRLMTQPVEPLLKPKVVTSLAASGGQTGSPGAVVGPAPTKKGKAGGKSLKDRLHAHGKGKNAGHKAPSLANLGTWPGSLPADTQASLNLLAYIRWVGQDPSAAAGAIDDPDARERWGWSGEETAWALAQLGRGLAWRLQPQAPVYFERAMAEHTLALGAAARRAQVSRSAVGWSPDTLAWMARAALRAATSRDAEPVMPAPAAWALVEQAIEAMPPEAQQDGVWLYWRAKALQGRKPAEIGRAHV